MLMPGMAFFIIFHYTPMYGVTLAFKDFRFIDGILGSPWVGLKYFRKAFADPSFYKVLRNTVFISFYKLLFGFPVPILFALLLSELPGTRFKKVVQTVSYLPHFISWVILAGIFITIFSLDGPINGVRRFLGMKQVVFLAGRSYFRSILVVTDIWQSFGWNSVIYFAAISGIDPELHEAAHLDGASRFQRTVRITLPLLSPVIAILLILRMGSILNAGFDQIFNMYNASVYEVADIIDTYVYRKGLVEMQYSLSTAVGLFKSGIALILIVTTNQIVKLLGGEEYTLW